MNVNIKNAKSHIVYYATFRCIRKQRVSFQMRIPFAYTKQAEKTYFLLGDNNKDTITTALNI